MLYKKVKNRLLFITLLLLVSLVVVFFSIKTLNNNLLYFKSPTDIFENQNIQFQKKIRLGGMVKKNSILVNNKEIKFIITDYKNEIIVSYSGSIPNLFLEEKGVVAEGVLKDNVPEAHTDYFIALISD